jgi:precorrin-3B synthase
MSDRLRIARELAIPDTCPGVLRLHAAADGYLARVRLPGGRLDARALEALAEAASLGSDIVELTSRAGLQVRGLARDSAEMLAGVLARGGLLRSAAHDRVRNILAAPLAGRGPGALADVDPIVEALDGGLCTDLSLAELSGRFLFAIDDGTGGLGPVRADIELAAERDQFRLRLDGLATSLLVSPACAPDEALRAARAFLTLRAGDADGAWRVRELPNGAARLAEHLGLNLLDRPASPAARRGRGLGLRLQRDGLLAGAVLPPLARLGRAQLVGLAEIAGSLDASVRVSPWRTLTFVDVPASAAVRLLGDLQNLGLVVSDASGWAGLSACAGLGACARARTDVRAAAARRATARTQDSPAEHWSGCERRCGEPADAGVRVVAHEHGLVVTRGSGEAGPADGQVQTVTTTAAALELLEHASVPA